MKRIVIEGKDADDLEALHLQLKETLDFPDYYGMNLDALWDMLTAWVELPLEIEWKNFDVSKEKLGSGALLILKTFKDADKVTISIKRTPKICLVKNNL